MCFKQGKSVRQDEAARRLADRPTPRPSHASRPRGNPDVDRRDLERSLERLEALVGR